MPWSKEGNLTFLKVPSSPPGNIFLDKTVMWPPKMQWNLWHQIFLTEYIVILNKIEIMLVEKKEGTNIGRQLAAVIYHLSQHIIRKITHNWKLPLGRLHIEDTSTTQPHFLHQQNIFNFFSPANYQMTFGWHIVIPKFSCVALRWVIGSQIVPTAWLWVLLSPVRLPTQLVPLSSGPASLYLILTASLPC